MHLWEAMASPCENCIRSSLSTCPEERMQPSRDWLCNKVWTSTSRGASHKPATETDRRSESQTRRLRTWSRSPERGGGVRGGGGSVRGSQGGFTPGGFFDSSRRIFRRIFLADFSFAFCDQKQSTAKSTAPWRVLVSEIHRPWGTRNSPAPPPKESKSKSCAFGSGTVTFQGGSFQEKTPGLIGPRNLRILIGRIAVGWPCMECHVPCHISIYWVWDSVKQSEGWGRNTALIARSPKRNSYFLLKSFITNRLCWFGSLT